jgi:hypothetical protein
MVVDLAVSKSTEEVSACRLSRHARREGRCIIDIHKSRKKKRSRVRQLQQARFCGSAPETSPLAEVHRPYDADVQGYSARKAGGRRSAACCGEMASRPAQRRARQCQPPTTLAHGQQTRRGVAACGSVVQHGDAARRHV